MTALLPRNGTPNRTPSSSENAMTSIPNSGCDSLAVAEESQPEFGIEVIAFSEEEGVRFGVPFLGSKAVIGTLDRAVLQRQDKRGITVTQAIRDFGLDPDRIESAVFRS